MRQVAGGIPAVDEAGLSAGKVAELAAAAAGVATRIVVKLNALTDVPLIEQTIGAFFDAMAVRQPQLEALVSLHQGRRYSYAALAAEVDRLASACAGSLPARAQGEAGTPLRLPRNAPPPRPPGSPHPPRLPTRNKPPTTQDSEPSRPHPCSAAAPAPSWA